MYINYGSTGFSTIIKMPKTRSQNPAESGLEEAVFILLDKFGFYSISPKIVKNLRFFWKEFAGQVKKHEILPAAMRVRRLLMERTHSLYRTYFNKWACTGE
jgi:hypothetical protein